MSENTGSNCGHGWVVPNPGGVRARCGGPAICQACKADLLANRPGSPVASANGCTCPVIDNGHGMGYMGQAGVYVMWGDCPIHGDGTR